MMYIGLPQWSHPKWVRLGITGLEEYARHFNCVKRLFEKSLKIAPEHSLSLLYSIN